MERERQVISSLIEECNLLYNLDLAREVEYSRHKAGSGSEEVRTVAIIGGSHAFRLGEAMRSLGVDVANLASPGWKVSPERTDDLKRKIDELVKEHGGKLMVVFQPLDNSVYFASSGMGTRNELVRDENGTWHVAGRLVMADQETIKEILNVLTPALRAAKNIPKFVLSPLPRYIMARCCECPSHLTNKDDIDFAESLGDRLLEIKNWMREWLHKKDLNPIRILNPLKIVGAGMGRLGREDARRMFGSDPVHLTAEGYMCLAKKIREISEEPPAEVGTARGAVRNNATAARNPYRGGLKRRGNWQQYR